MQRRVVSTVSRVAKLRPAAAQEVRDESLVRPLPAAAWVAICLTAGIFLGSRLPESPSHFLLMAGLWLALAVGLHRLRAATPASVCVLATVTLLGICHWQIQQASVTRSALRDLADTDASAIIRLRATVHTIPAVHVRPSSEFSPRQFGSAKQTRFQIAGITVIGDSGAEYPVDGVCQVYIDGNNRSLSMGDEVLVTGRLECPGQPGNPGQFDYERFLQRRQISGLVRVRHPAAVAISEPASRLNPAVWVSWLRRTARHVLTDNVDPDMHGVALALLLGDRNQIPSDTQHAFVTSGTMHLLAISGLHNRHPVCVFAASVQSAVHPPHTRSDVNTACLRRLRDCHGSASFGRPGHRVFRGLFPSVSCCGGN